MSTIVSDAAYEVDISEIDGACVGKVVPVFLVHQLP